MDSDNKDSRNVIDRYKDWMTDLIKDDLNKKSLPYAVLMEHWGDYNFGTLVRNANAFGAKEVFYFGKKKWDRRGAQGTYNYKNVQYLSSLEEVKSLQDKYVIVGIDNIPGSVSISNYQWEPNTLFLFGEEGSGLSAELQSLCKDIVHIDMIGSVRSLNCGTASGIVMFDYINKHNKKV